MVPLPRSAAGFLPRLLRFSPAAVKGSGLDASSTAPLFLVVSVTAITSILVCCALLLLLVKGFVAVDVCGQKGCFLLAVDLLFGVLTYQHSARVLGRTVLVRQPYSVLIDRGLDDLAVAIHAMDLSHSVGGIQQGIVL